MGFLRLVGGGEGDEGGISGGGSVFFNLGGVFLGKGVDVAPWLAALWLATDGLPIEMSSV